MDCVSHSHGLQTLPGSRPPRLAANGAFRDLAIKPAPRRRPCRAHPFVQGTSGASGYHLLNAVEKNNGIDWLLNPIIPNASASSQPQVIEDPNSRLLVNTKQTRTIINDPTADKSQIRLR